jgi:hypothetical protein
VLSSTYGTLFQARRGCQWVALGISKGHTPVGPRQNAFEFPMLNLITTYSAYSAKKSLSLTKNKCENYFFSKAGAEWRMLL